MRPVTDRRCENLFESEVISVLTQHPLDGVVTNNVLIPHLKQRWLPNELDILVLLPGFIYVIDAKALMPGSYRGPADGKWEYRPPNSSEFDQCDLSCDPVTVALRKQRVLLDFVQELVGAPNACTRSEPEVLSIIVVPSTADINALQWDEARQGMRLPLVRLCDLNETLERDFRKYARQRGRPSVVELVELLDLNRAQSVPQSGCRISRHLFAEKSLDEARFDGIPLARQVFSGRKLLTGSKNYDDDLDFSGPSVPVRFEFISKYGTGHPGRGHKAWRNYDAIAQNLGRHEAMLRLLNSYDRPTDFMLIFELFSTTSLRQKLDVAPLSWSAARRLFAPVVALLRLAHSEGIAHRFLTPACLLLGEGESTEVRVRGFYGALFPELSALTAAHPVEKYLKTFSAPEYGQIDLGDIDTGKRLDIYSVGRCIVASLTQDPQTQLSHIDLLTQRERSIIETLMSERPQDRTAAWESLPDILNG